MLEFLKIGSKFLVPFNKFVGTELGYGGLLRRHWSPKETMMSLVDLDLLSKDRT